MYRTQHRKKDFAAQSQPYVDGEFMCSRRVGLIDGENPGRTIKLRHEKMKSWTTNIINSTNSWTTDAHF